MTTVLRRIVLVAVLVALVAATAVQAACPTNCKVCVIDACVTCNDGYYPSANVCTPCKTEHCAQCFVAGMCTSCTTGYHITYANQTANGTDVNLQGICAPNAALGAPSARSAAAAVLLAAVACAMAL